MGEARIQTGIEILTSYGIPNYPFPERTANAFHAMSDYRTIKTRPIPEYTHFIVDTSTVKAVFEKARSAGRLSIGDAESRAILQAYWLRIPRSELAETPEQASILAGKIGYPVVLKIASPDILHKTDIGGVKVGLQDAEDVRDAFELMVYRDQKARTRL